MADWLAIQRALKAKGFDPGPLDGIQGPKTDDAIVAFKRSVGLRARPYIGPLTLEKLLGKVRGKVPGLTPPVPWMNEAAKHIGLHEGRNFAALAAWLRSDGKTLGDPRKLPWCGDFVDTCLRLTLPNEPRPGALGKNPYLARNWLLLGEESPPAYGAVVVFWRGSRSGHSGHVGFAVAFDPVRNRIKVRGGNQSNSVSDAWLGADRILGYRKPSTWKEPLPPLPGTSSAGAAVSTNEA